jgi:hypothetical protein
VTNEGEVYFSLYGTDFDPDEITKRLGLEPTSIRRQASPRPKHSSWNLSSGKIENDIIDVYEMSSVVVAKLQPYASELSALKQQLRVEAVLQVVLWFSTDETKSTPAIGFEPKVIAFLSAVGASIDIDTYHNAP